jgi:hypothetical protein
MKYYHTKNDPLPGSNYNDIHKQVNGIYNKIEKRTKRQPYIRSAYFKKEKIFFNYFWQHIRQKREKDKVRRLKYFACAIDLIQNSKNEPEINVNRNRSYELLYKFFGKSSRKIFFVQIKENKKTGAKYLMSCFPEK